jgi:hypothetical protein
LPNLPKSLFMNTLSEVESGAFECGRKPAPQPSVFDSDEEELGIESREKSSGKRMTMLRILSAVLRPEALRRA